MNDEYSNMTIGEELRARMKKIYGEPETMIGPLGSFSYWSEKAKQPALTNGGSVEYHQPTIKTDYYPNQTAIPLGGFSKRPVEEDELLFDGRELQWVNDGRVYKSWGGLSGQEDYQQRVSQTIPNKGPIPEGEYAVKQNELQHFPSEFGSDAYNMAGGMLKKLGSGFGKWPGGKVSWGNHRVWLKPDDETNTFGRTNFSIHGGRTAGSAGCIDLAGNMDDFVRNYQDYGQDINLKVKYPGESW